jgi:hypothetical protein
MLIICPKVVLLALLFGTLNSEWLNVLKNSARNLQGAQPNHRLQRFLVQAQIHRTRPHGCIGRSLKNVFQGDLYDARSHHLGAD